MKEKIVIIDDEKEIVELIKRYLVREGFTVVCGNNAAALFRIIQDQTPDLIILDIMLPDIDGLEISQILRKEGYLNPLILISAKSDDADKVLGLGVGADDYITKPFSPNELVARVKAHLRRIKLMNDLTAPKNTVLCFSSLEIDLKSRSVTVCGKPVSLRSKEYEILSLLAQHPNQVFKRSQLYELVWGIDSVGDDRTVMVHIRHLREKIETDPNNPTYIKTVWGIGYLFKPA